MSEDTPNYHIDKPQEAPKMTKNIEELTILEANFNDASEALTKAVAKAFPIDSKVLLYLNDRQVNPSKGYVISLDNTEVRVKLDSRRNIVRGMHWSRVFPQ